MITEEVKALCLCILLAIHLNSLYEYPHPNPLLFFTWLIAVGK